MVCKAGQICLIQCNLSTVGNKICNTDKLLLHEFTRGEDLYFYIAEHYQIQPDSFKLYLISDGILIDLSEKKDKTMLEVGVDFSFNRESSIEHKHTLLVMDPTIISLTVNPAGRHHWFPYNSPPPSPNHLSVWGEDNNLDFKYRIKSETCYVGLVNQAMTCYLNSLLQALYMTPEFRNALYNWEYIDGSEKDEANSIPYQLQKLFLNLQTSTKSAVETTALTKSFGWDSTEAWQQHDIQELCRVMFDALEQKFKNTEQADLINRFYEGKMIDYVKCLECGTEKSREDTFLDIPLPVRPFGSSVAYTSVEEALRAFVQYEILEGSNQYHCEKCNKKCDAHKGLKFTKFPYLMTLHLKRFDFDFKTFHRIKLNDKVTFPDILNLNPFIASMPNQESPSTDENIGLAKCDDNSITDSGTLDDDCPPCENSLPNSNHSTSHDQDDDEGIDMGPSTSNSTMHNHENEKNRSTNTVTGPYNYELFSIMIHSGSASGGHYYAYIKDFRTQEWFCFNDQSVTQITHDDIQKTYGGGSTRSYFSGANTSTNAYMLMYRQIDPIRNSLPMQVQDFPKHIQELLKKMKENEDNDRKKKIREKEKELFTPNVRVFCQHPTEGLKMNFRMCFSNHDTLAQLTQHVYKKYCLEGIVSLNQCRLVAYDHNNDLIVASYEGKEHETFASIWFNRVVSRCSLLLEIRDEDKKFEPHLRGAVITKVYVVDVARKKLVEGPINVRGLFTQTVREYKQVVGEFINMDPDDMKIVLRKHESQTIFVQNDDAILAIADFCNFVKVIVYTMSDAEYSQFYLEAVICKIAEQFENILTLHIRLPLNSSKEMLEELNIPTLEEVCKDKEKPVTDSPSKAGVTELHRDSGTKCNETLKSGKFVEDTPVRNSSPQLAEGEEWHTPEQSNSEDSSLSDSDKTLVGDASGDNDFQLPYFPSSTSNRAIKMLNQGGLENWDNITDDSEYYFKATPYTNLNEKFLKVLVDKRMIFNTLKKNLEPYVGVPADYFKICRCFDDCIESEYSRIPSQFEDGEKFWIEIERALRNGEFTVKLHQFFLDSSEFLFLFEWIVSEDMTVGQVKKEILAEMKRKYNIDIPYERCRLRERYFTLASKVLLDHQKFKDFQFYSQFGMVVQELPDKDPVTNSNQVIIYVRRWFATKIHLGPPQEIVLDETTVEEMVKKLSLISDIPEKYINIIRGKVSTHISTIQIENGQDWIGLTTGAELIIEDGAVFLYRDIREDSKQLTREEFNEIAIQEVPLLLPLSSASRYNARKEKALRIYLDDE